VGRFPRSWNGIKVWIRGISIAWIYGMYFYLVLGELNMIDFKFFVIFWM